MNTDYWQKFVESGSVQDYLAYRSSLKSRVGSGSENEKPDHKSNRNSYKGSQDKGKR